MNFDILIAFIGATALLALSPGPDNIYVLVQSIANGKSYAMATVCGLISGCIVHTTLLAFGVSTLLKTNTNVFLAIKLFGAAYLVYLAYKVYKSDAFVDITANTSKKSLKALFVQGFFMNVLNPKVTLFFLAFFPGFLFSDTLSTVVQFYVLGGVFMLVSFTIFSAITLLAAPIKTYVEHSNGFNVFLKWIQIIVFVGIAIFILV